MNKGTVNYTDANKILWQRGYALVQNGNINYLDNDAWRDHVDMFNPTNTTISAMMNSTNSQGQAVELYFVTSLANPDLDGLCTGKGIAIAAKGDSRIVAHEVLHSCGLEDIYTLQEGNENTYDPIPGSIEQHKVPLDWGGGYYNPSLTQRQLVSQLVMRSGGDGMDRLSPYVVPRGIVWGWIYPPNNYYTAPRILGLAGALRGRCGEYEYGNENRYDTDADTDCDVDPEK